ncbi:MAG: hypothetical protein F6K65_14475 [Moorea sp. SIO3C2]|nr:hypothetical protein [Moorena sp. SIO3C2]
MAPIAAYIPQASNPLLGRVPAKAIGRRPRGARLALWATLRERISTNPF